jgi:hypothetical protein
VKEPPQREWYTVAVSTQFPAALDSFTNPTAANTLANATPPHSQQHANLNDVVAALEAKVGIDGSPDTATLDHRTAALESGKADASHTHTAAQITDFTAGVQVLLSVLSVFGRTGTITAQAGDYSAFYALLVHVHTIADVIGLQAALDALAPAYTAKTFPGLGRQCRSTYT